MSTEAVVAKKKFPWMWVIILALLGLAIVVGIVVYRNKSFLNTTVPPGAGGASGPGGNPPGAEQGK